MTIKAVIFDMDGVLVDARDWHFDSLNWALNKFGLNISYYDHEQTFDGLPTKTKLQMLTDLEKLPSELHQLINELKQKYTMYITHERCAPNFQHKRALSDLRREGYKLAVASNSIRSTVKTMMEMTQLAQYLEFFLGSEDVSKSKPDPEIYTKSIRDLGMQPHECLVVEDNENGIKAAISSGAHLLKVSEVNDVTYENIRKAINEANRCK